MTTLTELFQRFSSAESGESNETKSTRQSGPFHIVRGLGADVARFFWPKDSRSVLREMEVRAAFAKAQGRLGHRTSLAVGKGVFFPKSLPNCGGNRPLGFGFGAYADHNDLSLADQPLV